jgi:hypothetical protein
MCEFSTVELCDGKMKALLAAKRSPVRWGSQMCLNVRWDSIFFVFMQQKFFNHSVFYFFLLQ